VDKLAENLSNKLAIFTEAAKGSEDRLVGASFKVGSGDSASEDLTDIT
jgi:hypothetical protein